MAGKRSLRAVKPGEAPPAGRRRPKTIVQAVASGDRRALLVALQKRIATALSDCDCRPRELAELTRQLREIAREIQDLDAEQEAAAEDNAAVNSNEPWDDSAI